MRNPEQMNYYFKKLGILEELHAGSDFPILLPPSTHLLLM